MPDELPFEFIQREHKQLSAYEEQRVRRFMRLLDASRAEILELIRTSGDQAGGFQRYRLAQIQNQLDAIHQSLARELQQEHAAIGELDNLIVSHARAEYLALEPATIGLEMGVVKSDILRGYSESVSRQLVGMSQTQIDTLRSVLFSKVGVMGKNPAAVARQLAGKGGLFDGMRPRVETILRTETSIVYNQSKLDTITEAAQNRGVVFNKRIVETVDPVRNHPISPVIRDMVQLHNQPFRVPVSQVVASANRLGRATKSLDRSIFWIRKTVEGVEVYEGNNLPAHFNERGTVVPTKKPVNFSK